MSNNSVLFDVENTHMGYIKSFEVVINMDKNFLTI